MTLATKEYANASPVEQLEKYLLAIIVEKEKARNAVDDANRKADALALEKALAVQMHRLEVLNGNQEAMREDRRLFANRIEVEAEIKSLRSEMGTEFKAVRATTAILDQAFVQSAGKGAGVAAAWGYLVAGIVAASAVATIIALVLGKG